MPFGFYVFDVEACKLYAKTVLPQSTQTVSGCEVASLGIAAEEERARVRAAPRAPAQPRWPFWHGEFNWVGSVHSLIRTSFHLPHFSLSRGCNITISD